MKMTSEASFLSDLLEFYRSRKKTIDRRLNINRGVGGEARIRDFCFDVHGRLPYENLCKLSLVFANVLGSRLPDHIHARILLGFSNEWVSEYMYYVRGLRPYIFGFNLNPNNFRMRTLGVDGSMSRMTSR
jgi:hypothetical protein